MFLNDLGILYNDLGKYQISVEVLNQALSLVQLKEHPNQINDSRLQELEQAIQDSLGTDGLVGFVYFNLGESYRGLEDDQQALYAYDIGFRLLQPLKMRLKQVNSDFSQFLPFVKGLFFSIMSLSYSDLGLSQQATDLDTQLQRLIESLGDTEIEKFTQFNSLRTKPGEETLDIVNRLRFLFGTSPEGEATWYMGRGFGYFDLKNYRQSLAEYNKALQLLQNVADPLLRASALSDKAVVLLKMDKISASLDILIQALSFARQSTNSQINPQVIANILEQIGETRRQLKEYEQARDAHTEALKIWHTVGISAKQADGYFGLAEVERSSGNFIQALTLVEQAIKTVELTPQSAGSGYIVPKGDAVVSILNGPQPITLTSTTTQSNNDRIDYFRSKQQYYDFYIDLLMELHRQHPKDGYDIQALQVNERSRTCSLQTFIKEKNLQDGTRKEQQGREKSQIQAVSNLCSEPDQPLEPAEIQSLLDSETIVLEYALGEKRSYLWVITNKRIATYELPKRQKIEEAAREFYRYLTEPGLRVRPNKAKEAGAKLSQIVLGPISRQLKNQRLMIVADGVLQYIPFSALPNPQPESLAEGKGFAAMQPLLVKHEIVNLPAASTLPALRRSQYKRKPASRELAIFADPVFNLEDDRLQKVLTQPSQDLNRPYLALVKEAIESPGSQSDLPEPPVAIYPRLSGTQDESDRIIEQILKSDPAAKISQFVGFNANYRAATDPELSQYRIVHFATHGLLNSNNPTRSGVVLSAIDEMGGLQRGLLSASDTFKLQLDADLVVVSGCRTGLAADVDSGEAIAEGLFGLTGGFINAGAQRVVVSLWSVNDKATAEFMSRFYQHMLDPKLNLTPSQALREAQLSMWNEKRWQNPYYWAAFTIHGDWR